MTRAFVVAVVLGGVLTACTGDTEEPAGEGAGAGSKESDSSQDGRAEEVSFGDAAEYDSGVSIRVGEPKAFAPSKKAQVGVEPNFVTFKVTVANDSKKRVAPREFSISVESGGAQAGQVIDRKKGITNPPRQRVAPGGEVSWKVAFGVIDPEDVIVQVQHGLDEDPVVVSSEG